MDAPEISPGPLANVSFRATQAAESSGAGSRDAIGFGLDGDVHRARNATSPPMRVARAGKEAVLLTLMDMGYHYHNYAQGLKLQCSGRSAEFPTSLDNSARTPATSAAVAGSGSSRNAR